MSDKILFSLRIWEDMDWFISKKEKELGIVMYILNTSSTVDLNFNDELRKLVRFHDELSSQTDSWGDLRAIVFVST